MARRDRKDLASRPAARCGVCKVEYPAAAFYPSEFKKYPHPRCKSCHRAVNRVERQERSQNDAQTLRDAFGERDSWTSLEAAALMGWHRLNAGSHLELLRRDGYIERIATGVYRFPAAAAAALQSALPLAPAAPVAAAPLPVAPAPTPTPTGPAKDPFIEAGPYFFVAANIACVECDDRGRVSVMLNVQETRPNGYTAPVTFELEGDEAARFIYNVSLLRGQPPVELMQRIDILTTERDAARKDRDTARQERDAARHEVERWRTLAEPLLAAAQALQRAA